MKTIHDIYYLPGRNETCREHAGAVIERAGLTFYGRDMTGDFLRLPFDGQVRTVQADIEQGFMNETGLLIGRSYGGYILLHAICELGAYPGSVLLFNPALGRYLNAEQMCGIIPPRADRLLSLAKEGKIPAIRSLVIVSGEKDTQCPAAAAREFMQNLQGEVRLKSRAVPPAGSRVCLCSWNRFLPAPWEWYFPALRMLNCRNRNFSFFLFTMRTFWDRIWLMRSALFEYATPGLLMYTRHPELPQKPRQPAESSYSYKS